MRLSGEARLRRREDEFAPMIYSEEEVLETRRMLEVENLDVRTVTLGVDIGRCADSDPGVTAERVLEFIVEEASGLMETADAVEDRFGVPIVNRRMAVTPLSELMEVWSDASVEDAVELARAVDEAAEEVGINFVGGYTSHVEKGFARGDELLFDSVPEALDATERLCCSLNVASTDSGINVDAVARAGEAVKQASLRDWKNCARLVVFANAPQDNPFMAGAFHGHGEPSTVLNVGVSGPGTVKAAIPEEASLDEVAEAVKRTAFKITRAGELVGREVAEGLGVEFGSVDLSLAPTPKAGDSVAEILEAIGVERTGAPGSTAALSLLTEAVKRGGAMASSSVGGLSGSFIPVSEDSGLARAVEEGALSVEKLEAMTAVCSIGLDMVPLPGDVSAETLAAIVADECAIGVVNDKAAAARLIPVPGAEPGDEVEMGGLLGGSPVMEVSGFSSESFVSRGGRIPAPLKSLGN